MTRTKHVLDDGDEHGRDDDNDDEDGSETLEAAWAQVMEMDVEDYVV